MHPPPKKPFRLRSPPGPTTQPTRAGRLTKDPPPGTFSVPATAVHAAAKAGTRLIAKAQETTAANRAMRPDRALRAPPHRCSNIGVTSTQQRRGNLQPPRALSNIYALYHIRFPAKTPKNPPGSAARGAWIPLGSRHPAPQRPMRFLHGIVQEQSAAVSPYTASARRASTTLSARQRCMP